MFTKVKNIIYPTIIGALFALFLLVFSSLFKVETRGILWISFLMLYLFAFGEELTKAGAHYTSKKKTKFDPYINMFFACIGFYLAEQIHYFYELNHAVGFTASVFGVRSILVFLIHVVVSFLGLLSFNYLHKSWSYLYSEIIAISIASLVHFSINLSFTNGNTLVGVLILTFFSFVIFENVIFIPSKKASLR